MLADNLYWYLAQLTPTKRDPTGVVDGDTMHAAIDIGGFIYAQRVLRVYGINAPEMSTDTGKAAKAWAISWFAKNVGGGNFYINTFLDPDDKYGRFLAKIYALDGTYFNDDIVNAGMAVPYFP